MTFTKENTENFVSLEDIRRAEKRINKFLHHTPLVHSKTFSKMCGGDVYLKCENMQKTGSFKIRGAANKLSRMQEEGKPVPVVASSAGNHAQGLACAAGELGVKATIVMPKTAPIAKVQATEGYGAKVVLAGDCYDDAYTKACEICKDENAEFIHPYNDLDVISGQGTIGMEMLEDLPEADIIVVPAGGGGLLAGVASAVKAINPNVKVIGVQAEGAPAIASSFKEKTYLSTDNVSTIADGIAVKVPGDITVDIINKLAYDVVTVSDSDIASAILLLMERCKLVVEPAGASSLAAVLSGKVDAAGKKVVCLLSGGNIDTSFIQSIIERGLVAANRRMKFSAILLDRPGSLSGLLNVVAGMGANILSVQHDKFTQELNPNEIAVDIVCEVAGMQQQKAVAEGLLKAGYRMINK